MVSRQIKNAIRTAQATTVFNKEALSYKALDYVLGTLVEFGPLEDGSQES